MELKKPLFTKESWLNLQAIYNLSWCDGDLSVVIPLKCPKPQIKRFIVKIVLFNNTL